MKQDGSDNIQAEINRRSTLRIFVSYRHDDDSSAAQLTFERLQRDGFKRENIFIDSGQVAGESWVDQIEQALDDCDVLIAIVGNRWLDAVDTAGRKLDDLGNWTRHEIEVGLERRIPIIPVLTPGAQMPSPDRVPSLASFVEIQGIRISTEGAGHEQLVARLDEIAHEIDTTKISNLRQRNRSFIGREELLTQISRELNGPRDTTAVVAIVGLPAVGKTQLALEFAHRQQDSYRIIWQIPAEQPATCREKFGELSRELKLRQWKNEDPSAAVRAALERTEGWMLILDNVKDEKDIEDLIPRSGGHVLITSQHSTWDAIQAVNVSLDVMTEKEAIALLRKRLPQGSDADLSRLAGALMYIPQALEQASAYIRTRHMPIANYINMLPGHESELLDKIPAGDYTRTLFRAWKFALEEVERIAHEKGPGAVEILNLCAFLAAEDIPLEIFGNCASALPEPPATTVADPVARADAIGLLADLSQVRWTDNGAAGLACVSLHRTVQYFVRVLLGTAARQTWGTAAVSVVLAAFPEYPSDVLQWKTCNSLLPHARAALEAAAELDIEPLHQARLLDRIGIFLKSEAQFADAKVYLRTALAILDPAIPEYQVTAATVRNHLGSLSAELGDFANAYADCVAALAVHEELCGPESLEAAEDLLNIGRVLEASDDLAGAGLQYEKALRIRTSVFGPNHITVIECHGALFALSLRAGKVLGARPHLEQLLNAREALGQQDHPDAMWYRFMDDLLFGESAEESPYSRFEDMISITAGMYTPRHPEIASWRTWQADDLLSSQQFGRAEEKYRQALKIDEEAYGDKHWRVASDLLRIFLTQAVKGQTDDARQNLNRAIIILRQVSTVNNAGESVHRDTDSGFVLAKFDDALNRLGEVFAAVRPFQRICEIVADNFGEDSSLYASALEHFAAELREAGHPDYIARGLSYLETAHNIFVRRCGPDHHRTARCLRHLGSLQAANNQTEKATASYARALEILDAESQPDQIELLTVLAEYYPVLAAREKRAAIQPPGPDPADGSSSGATRAPAGHTAQDILDRTLDLAKNSVGVWALVRRADVLAESNQPGEALEIYEQALEILKNTYGERRPVVANCLRSIGRVLTTLGDPGAALSRYNETLEIDRAFFGPEHDSVAYDLRLRAFSFAALGDASLAAESLGRSLDMTERLDQKRQEELDPAAMMDRRLRQWTALGDGANEPDAALSIYRIGLDRAGDVPGAGRLRARIGGIAAIRGDSLGAVDYFRASISRHIADGSSDPFWATVRDATPVAHDSTGRERLTTLLSSLREDPSMQQQIRTFQPQIAALIPQDWNAKESITLLSPDGQANIIASSEPISPEVDIDRYALAQGDLLRREFPEYQELQFEEAEVFDGLRGYTRHFEWKPSDGVRVTQIQLYYVEDQRGYTVTATTPSSNFGHAEVVLRQILGGLKLSR